MADLSNVMALLVSKVAAIVYPNGTNSASIANVDVRIFQGWPIPNVLESDLANGSAQISIYALPTEQKLPVELGRPTYITDSGITTIVATVSGKTVTFSGSIASNQNVALIVNGKAYVHAVQVADTLSSIATAFATSISGASSLGAVLTIPSAYEITVRIGGVGHAIKLLRRQSKEFQITVWAPTPDARSSISSQLDAQLTENSSLTFADGSGGTMTYCRTMQSDSNEKSGLYRRDLIYAVDYSTTKAINDTAQILVVQTDIADTASLKTISTQE